MTFRSPLCPTLRAVQTGCARGTVAVGGVETRGQQERPALRQAPSFVARGTPRGLGSYGPSQSPPWGV